MHKKSTYRVLALLLAVGMLFSMLNTTTVRAENTEPQAGIPVAPEVLTEMEAKGTASYWIEFTAKTDLSPAYNMGWSERGWYVYNTLSQAAKTSQARVAAYLENSRVEYQSYWIKNTILVKSSNLTTLNGLLGFSEISAITPRQTFILYEPDTSAAVIDNGVKAVEPNLIHVNADDVWAMGIDGTGLVVANVDTGVRFTHQALVNQYRGNLGGGSFDHNYNWFNPDDLTDNAPRDGNGHGTHTMGTMVGDDGGSNQIGIAPGAKWMACAGCPDGSCTDSALLGCGQFIAAPTDLTGGNADPDMRPNAVNNSWGDCSQTYDSWYASPIAAWQAAGVYPIFSNGNASNCGYSAPPGLNTVGNPARSGNVTGVGSSGEQNGQYATHSNWGPTDNADTVNPTGGFVYMKPQVLAPGVSIRSSTPGSDTEYQDGWSGTSMSAPHVTGLVALIWQAAPCLVGDYATTENIIEETAVNITYADGSTDTPTDWPNYATGWGEIDALAAVTQASGLCAMGTLEGVVTEDGTTPIEGAQILADNGSGYTKKIYSAADGSYSSGLPEGTYTLTASKYGYDTVSVSDVDVTEDVTTTQDFVLEPLGTSLVSGVVYDAGVEGLGAHGYPLYAAIHVTTGSFDQTIYSDPFTGYYEIELVSDTEHSFTTTPLAPGYEEKVEAVTPSGANYTHDIPLVVEGEACAAPGYKPDYDFFYSFESSDEGFTPGGTTSFAWGDFTSGPGEGHSGTKGIATNPGGNYNPSELGWMASPVLDMTGYGTNSIAIQWWDWKDIESASYDWARLDVTKDGGATWDVVWGPVGGVSDTSYSQQTVLLDPSYNVANFQFRFYFKSDSSVQYEGWYVDDVGVVAIPVPPPTTVFSSNFDSDNGGFTVSGTTTWAWGAPTSGPGAAHSAPNVWATNLAGNYNSSESGWITSPVIDLSAYAGLAPTLSFWNWMDTESTSFDWGVLEVTKDGGVSWQDVSGKIGDQLSWAKKVYQLDSSYAVSNFQFRFYFRSDSSVNYAGWYIDDVVVTVAEPVSVSAPCTVIPGGAVAGFVYNDNDGSPLVGADVYSAEVATQTISIPEDPANEGLYWAFQPFTEEGAQGTQSLTGSNVVFDPAAGGDAGYTPGVPATLCFTAHSYSPDWEYVYDLWTRFPTDWTVTDVYVQGTPYCAYGAFSDFSWSFETSPYEVDIEHQRSQFNYPDENCVATYCMEVTPGSSAGNVSWYWDGDNWGNAPHHPCSSDVYTPASMVAVPCDEWVNPQASVPLLGSFEAHDFTAEMALFGSQTETVNVMEDFITRQDFSLGTGELEFDPESFEVTMMMGDPVHEETLTIGNNGSSPAMFELVEKDSGFVPPLSIPAFTEMLPEDTRTISMGKAPEAAKTVGLEQAPGSLTDILAGAPAFAIDIYPGYNLVNIPDTDVPGVWNIVGSMGSHDFFAGDFVGGDFTTLYAVDYNTNGLYAINTATGAQTLIGPTAPPAGQTFSGLTGTPDGTMYGLVTSCSASSLVTVDIVTGATTLLGALPGIGCGIDLAYNTADDMIYIVELLTSNLMKVDPATLAVTTVGSLGVAPNYAQGMDFEEESGVLYWAAYISSGELRVIDTTTGASTLVGAFPSGAETDCLAFPTGGVSDVPWLSEDPVSGTVPAGGEQEVTISFDPTGAGLSQPGDYLAELKVKHDTPYTYPNIPVILHLFAPDTFGTVNGTVSGLEACDVNPEALEGATVNFWQGGAIVYTTSTNASGYYTYTVPAGTYDIEFVADGYVSIMESDVAVVGGSTLTIDKALRLLAPCLSVLPTELEQTQLADVVTTQTLTIVNSGAAAGIFELQEIPVIQQEALGPTYTYRPELDGPALDRSKSGPKNSANAPTYQPKDILLDEGFESGFPPADWAVQSQSPWTWELSDYSPHSGLYNAHVLYDQDLNEQDEWLVTPEFNLNEGTLSFWSMGSIYWCRDTYDNCDLNIWLVVDDIGGGDDIFIRAADSDWTASWTWANTTIDLGSYIPGGPVRIGFQYAGLDGAEIGLDDVTIDGTEGGDVPWLSEDPIAGTVPADGSQVITITYDSTGLAEGDYFATLRVKNPPAVAINIPVTLHITSVLQLYIPLLFK